jgi:hypothetical protein
VAAIDLTNAGVPRELHDDFAWLGRREWIRFRAFRPMPMRNSPAGTAMPTTGMDLVPGGLEGVGERRVGRLIRRCCDSGRDGYSTLCWLEACGVAVAGGPKIFQPTAEQFDAMRRVKIDIPPEDFRSPYPCLFVRVPAESRKALGEEMGVPPEDRAEWVMVRHADGTGPGGKAARTIFVFVKFTNTETYFICHDDSVLNKTLEQVITRWTDGDLVIVEPTMADHYSEACCRAALNLCLLLVEFGWRNAGPLDRVAYANHRKVATLARLRHGDFEAVELAQQVTVRRVVQAPAGDGGPTGREVRPHWRSGHWRRRPGHEAYEARGETPPRIFIRPVFVRRDRLVGDVADTSAIYELRD